MISQTKSRTTFTLKSNWRFSKSNPSGAHLIDFDDSRWQQVTVPHDWAIYGPFDKSIDQQVVAIEQNGETVATKKTGRTGALPYIGTAWYRQHFNIPNYQPGKRTLIVVEGARSEPEVFINGLKVGEWKYGYSYFYFDITEYVNQTHNLLAVKLTNVERSSRWYPGAGLYRKVQLIVTDQSHFKQWGTFISTPQISDSLAQVNIKSKVKGTDLSLKLELYNNIPDDTSKPIYDKLFLFL